MHGRWSKKREWGVVARPINCGRNSQRLPQDVAVDGAKENIGLCLIILLHRGILSGNLLVSLLPT